MAKLAAIATRACGRDIIEVPGAVDTSAPGELESIVVDEVEAQPMVVRTEHGVR
jgi:hypothetical protein